MLELQGRLEALQSWLQQSDIQAFLVPMSDPFQNEYVPDYYQRLKWLTGFQGSAGFVVVTCYKAAIFVDGRYTEQVKDQVNPDNFDIKNYTIAEITKWLKAHVESGARVGFDPWIHTFHGMDALENACVEAKITFVPLKENPIDALWLDRPALPDATAYPLALKYAGESSESKRQRLGAALQKKGRGATFIGDVMSLNWLLNIRGGDLPFTPAILGYGILYASGALEVFTDTKKIDFSLEEDISVQPFDALFECLKKMKKYDVTVLFPKQFTPCAVSKIAVDQEISHEFGEDICALPKAVKNAVETEGFRHCHKVDGLALTKFLHFIHTNGTNTALDEITAADALEAYRRESSGLVQLSFPTISAVGKNAALPHYQATHETAQAFQAGQVYLVDSGGQYKTGTTDVTRTVILGGTATLDQKRHYTLVLKGHIALASVVFPKGTTGSQLDALARQFLWKNGCDFAHGTGHGVGHFLNVHEGPQNISPRPNTVPLMPGMVISNEPGYYRAGDYGIRIENLVTVVPVVDASFEKEMLGFETLTLAPLDRNLVDFDLMTPDEISWIDQYHQRVELEFVSKLSPPAQAWLKIQTAPLR